MATQDSVNCLRAASEVQQDLAAACTLTSEVVWDVLGPDQSDILMRKLECLYPNVKVDLACKRDVRRAKRHNANLKEIRNKQFRNIWEQRKYTNGVLLHSIVYVIVTSELDADSAKWSHHYSIHPIFRTRRCLNANSSAGCCMLFIDEQSRVYQSWSDFVKNNELPIGTMVAPTNGCYSLNSNNEVQLEYSKTPAYFKKPLEVVDTLVSAVSVVTQATTIFRPTYSIFNIGAQTYRTIRDYQRMEDKVKHGTASSAAANFKLSKNVICLASSVATLGAYMAVSNGKSVSLTANMSIQAVNSAAAIINCTKLIFTTYDIFTRYFVDDEELDINDLMTFGSSLLLLTNSINNIAITSQLGNFDGNKLRNFVTNKIRAGLTQVAEEAVRFAGQNGGCFDLLRLVNDIPYNDVLSNMQAICKSLTYTGFLTTISTLGVPGSKEALRISMQIKDNKITQLDFSELTKTFGSNFVKRIANSHNFIDILNTMGLYLSENVIEMMLHETRQYIDRTVDVIEQQQLPFVPTEIVVFKIFTYAVKHYSDFTYSYLDKKRCDLIKGVTQYFQSLNPDPSNAHIKRSCDVCGGYFYLSRLS